MVDKHKKITKRKKSKKQPEYDPEQSKHYIKYIPLVEEIFPKEIPKRINTYFNRH